MRFVIVLLFTLSCPLWASAQAQDVVYDLGSDNQEAYERITNDDAKPLEAFGSDTLTMLEALKYGLQYNPAILQARLSFEQTAAEEQIARGQFNPVVGANFDTSHNRYPYDDETRAFLGYGSSASVSDQAGLSLSKQFRTGTTLTASSDLSRYEDRRSEDPDLNDSTLRLSVSQPLLRGFGEDITDGSEKIASLSTKSGRAYLLRDIGSIVNQIVQNFWGYADSVETLAIYKGSYQRVQSLLEQFDASAASGLYDVSERTALEARLADLDSKLLQAQDYVRSQRDNLGLSMGVKNDQRDQLPLPEYTLSEGKEMPAETYRQYLDYALQNRGDLISQRLGLEQTEIRMKQAENQLLPDLNLQGSVGKARTGEGEGFSDSLEYLYRGNNANSWTLGLSLSYPIGNDTARGLLAQEKAYQISQKLGLYDLERSVSFEIAESYETLESTRKQIAQSRVTFENFLKVFREKLGQFETGNTSVFDLRQSEEDLTNAESELALLLVQYYQQLSQFRYNTDTLLNLSDENALILEEKRLLSTSFFENETVLDNTVANAAATWP